jgi:hypothetical protein
MRKHVVPALCLLAAFASFDAWAGVCQDKETTLRDQGYDITLRAIAVCLGDPAADSDALVASFDKATPNADQEGARLSALIEATKILQSDVANHLQQSNPNLALWQRVDERLTEERRLLNNLPATDVDQVRAALLPEHFWTNLSSTGGNFGTLDGQSANAFGPTCANDVIPCPAFEDRRALVRVIKLGWRLKGYADHMVLDAHTRDASQRNARWQSYFHGALPQYWWEVWANGWRMEKDATLCPRDPATRIQQGFCNVPQNQLILLHPEAGLQWTPAAKKSDDLKGVLVIEAIGFNRWQWAGSDGTSVTKQLGGSLIAAYGNRGETPSWSYGAMLHYRSYNLAVTTNKDGDVGVLFNVALAGEYFGKRQKYFDYLQALKKPPIQDLLSGKWPPSAP